LQYAHKCWQSDPKLVLAAVSKDGSLLQFASEDIQVSNIRASKKAKVYSFFFSMAFFFTTLII
jgi:hypothetical protein